MSNEKQYLTELDSQLQNCLDKIQPLKGCEKSAYDALIQALKEVEAVEAKLRTDCGIGVRFNVIRMQLQKLVNEVEREIQILLDEQRAVSDQKVSSFQEDDVLVYVYLFNAQGNVLKTWQNLLLQSALFEHSVNRPIYAEKNQVEAVLRGKPNQDQHAYLEVVIKKDDIMKTAHGGELKDQYGYTLLRVRQGALRTENIKSLVHDDKSYCVNSDGGLVLKIE